MSNLTIKELTSSSRFLPEVRYLYISCFEEGDSPDEGWGERAACWQKSCLDDDRGNIVPYVEVGTPCPTCQTPMTEAYPPDWTINYIRQELSYPNAIGLLGLINGGVAAGAWGYEGDIEAIALKKYPFNQLMADMVVSAYKKAWPQQPKTTHISEVFVAPKQRGNDYAQVLVNTMIKSARYPISSRTLETSPMKTVFGHAGLRQILTAGSDPGNKNRVVYASYE